MTSLEEIKIKLQKLIAKEESARELGNLAEAEAFASKIQQLLLQYELDMGEFKDKNLESNVVIKKMVDLKDLHGKHESNWICYLYGACRKANFCELLWVSNDQFKLILIGTEMNPEFLDYMVLQLVPKLRQLAKKSFAEYEGLSKRNTFIRSFLKGACDGIKSKLSLDLKVEEGKREEVHSLVIQKDRAVQEFMKREFPRMGFKKSRAAASADGYNQGVEAGRGVEINKGVKNRGNQRLLN